MMTWNWKPGSATDLLVWREAKDVAEVPKLVAEANGCKAEFAWII